MPAPRFLTFAFLVAAAATTAGCVYTPDSAYSLARQIEVAHDANVFRSARAVQCDMTAQIAGEPALQGAMTYETTGERCRIDLTNGTSLVLGDSTWISPASASAPAPGALYHLQVWPLFLSAPAKLCEPGTILKLMDDQKFDGRTYRA